VTEKVKDIEVRAKLREEEKEKRASIHRSTSSLMKETAFLRSATKLKEAADKVKAERADSLEELAIIDAVESIRSTPKKPKGIKREDLLNESMMSKNAAA